MAVFISTIRWQVKKYLFVPGQLDALTGSSSELEEFEATYHPNSMDK